MYAFVLLGLVLALVSVELAPEAPPPDRATVLLAMGAVALGVFAAGLALSVLLVWRRDALLRNEQRFLRTVGLLAKAYRLGVVAAYGAILFGLGWAALAADLAGGRDWMVLTFALVLAPLVVLFVLSWTALYWADRRLRAILFERAGVGAPAGRQTLPRYLIFSFRQYVLVILVPLFALLAIHDGLSRVLGPTEGEPLAAALGLAGTLLAVVTLAGPWVRVCWRTEPLPGGDLRRRLLDLVERARVRIGNVLVWRTDLSIANGCMVGAVGPLRYILITDALLLSLANEEVEAVFAHEVGHVKFRHFLLYMALAVGGLAAAVLVGEVVAAVTDSIWGFNAALAASVAAYWWFGFGYVSRRCELECDLYAVRAVSCPVGCSPADAGPYARRASGAAASPTPICEHRVGAFTSALRRIARLNGAAESAGGWRHFSVARRCRFLMGVLADPMRVGRFERRLRRLKRFALGLALLATAAVATLVLLASLSEPDHPEDPARPEDVRPAADRRLVRLVDGDQVDAVAFRSPEFHGHADATAQLCDGRLARLRRSVAPRDDNVPV